MLLLLSGSSWPSGTTSRTPRVAHLPASFGIERRAIQYHALGGNEQHFDSGRLYEVGVFAACENRFAVLLQHCYLSRQVFAVWNFFEPVLAGAFFLLRHFFVETRHIH